MQRLRDQARLEQLMRLWSLKESFVKVDGFGLSFPLVRVAFAVEGGERRAGGGGEQNREQAAAVVMDATAMLDKTGCAARSTCTVRLAAARLECSDGITTPVSCT